MSAADALDLRTRSLLLSTHPAGAPGDVAGIVEWFGAMQAQDLASGQWSLGARLPGSTLADVTAALERREAIRTWPMRGTVHLVPPADAHWMLDLMGVRALAGAAKRRAFLGLDEQTAERSVEVLGAALAGGKRLTRSQCMAALADAGVEVAGQLGYHLLWYASQRGVTCIAPNIGKEQSFVLLDEWAPKPNRPGREEALGIIALRYFRSHGPAPRKDFVGWTGLTATDAKAGVAAAGAALATVDVDGVEMIADAALLDAALLDADTTAAAPGDDWWALSGFDEFLLGYKDRSLMVDDEHKQAIIPGGNGVFRATIVRAGRVVATWTRTMGRAAVSVDVLPLVPLRAGERRRAEQALEPYAAFHGLPLRVRWPES
ncbi:winged helix DNA-binding domain-containing protein [Krasilnikovia sp. M28-CT-15]|uniref:winged helix DNA-binding domain-containing protein n=1 Tax=Krasilnikovia sp. M28-CT-15 TaxID=3373540 RepID=UPI00399CF50C